MAEDMSNPNMEAQLAEFTKLIQNTVKIDMPKDRRLEIIGDIVEDVADDLKTYCSRWKTATEQAEDGARQTAERNEELERMKREMAAKIEKLEEDERRRVEEDEQLEERRRQMDKRDEQQDERERQMDKREERDRLTRTIEHAHVQSEAARVQSERWKLVEEQHIFQAKEEAAKEANIRNKKRGLGPGPPEEPVSKRPCYPRRSSVGSAGTLTNFGPPAPLPENILDRIRFPPYRGWVIGHENAWREDDTSPSRTASTPSGAQGSLGSSFESRSGSSLMDPTTATRQTTIFNPESSSPGPLLQSRQSAVSATAPPGLPEAPDEVKNVWRQIEFPENWTQAASNSLLRGFKRNIHKNVPKHFRPAGLLDSSSASPNCLLRRLNKTKSAIDNGVEESCSACKEGDVPCVRVSLVAENLADVNGQDQDRRWKLTIREG